MCESVEMSSTCVQPPLKVVVISAAAAEGRKLKIHISVFIFLHDLRDILLLFNKNRHMYTNQCMANDAFIINLLFLESALGNTPVSYFHSIFIPCLNPLHN